MNIKMPHTDGLQPTDIIIASNRRPTRVVRAESQEATFRAIEKRVLLVYGPGRVEAL